MLPHVWSMLFKDAFRGRKENKRTKCTSLRKKGSSIKFEDTLFSILLVNLESSFDVSSDMLLVVIWQISRDIFWQLSCRRVGQKFWHICCFVSSESCFEAKPKPGADVQKARQILWGCPPQNGVSMCKVDDFGEDAIETSESNCYPTFDPFPTGISSRSCVSVCNVFLKNHSWWLFCI